VIALVLLVVGISSWLLARSLTRPLSRLSAAAQAFGAGELSARTGIRRSDELGDVGRAFDEMASRVTELLRNEKELLANVSHELRTPLARVRVALDLAAEGDAELARESLADIAADLDELERLIGDVLMAARMDLADEAAPGGLPAMRRELVDPTELLGVAAARFRAAHPTPPLDSDVAEGLAPLRGDAVLLRRAIENLLENAYKYSERPSEPVALRARARRRSGSDGVGGAAARRGDEPSSDRDGVEIEVSDRGVGISPEDLPRVCEPFYRADRSRTRATGGLGLGLALAKRIVDAHGGVLEIESALGHGTLARIWLPTSVASEGARPR
jgi:signal transduction histidine kinase